MQQRTTNHYKIDKKGDSQLNLQKLRLEKKVEQADLAKKIGTNAPMLSNFEHYKCLPIPEMLEKICDVLGCKASDIYSDEEIYVRGAAKTTREVAKSCDYGFYQLSVSLPNEKRAILTKANFKKCGYKNMKDFVVDCIKRFEKRLKKVNEKTAKHSNCQAVNTSDIAINTMHQ